MKISLNTVNQTNSISTINSNFNKLASELQDKVLYRRNPEGEPNELENDLDFNGHNLYNVGSAQVDSLTIDGEDVSVAAISAAVEATAADRIQTGLDRASTEDNAAVALSSRNEAVAAAIQALAVSDGWSNVAGAFGYEIPVPYAAGVNITRPTQTVEYNGEVYAAYLADIPFITSGTFETTSFRLIQGITTADLAQTTGADMIGYLPEGVGSTPATVAEMLNWSYTTPERFGAIADADEVAGTGTDNTTALRAAIRYCEDKGTTLLLLGKYRITDELFIRKTMRIVGVGAGSGYGGQSLLGYTMNSGFVVTGTGTRRIRTRVNYRGASTDPQDAPISTALNVQAENVGLENFAVYLWFNRPADGFDPVTEKTNYGADWDVGIFNGCRVHMSMDKVHVMGYWRQAAVLHDVTRGGGLVEFSDPNGVPYNAGTVRNGADGLTLNKCFFYGGRWGLKIQGPLPKSNLPWYGYRLTIGATITIASQPIDGATVTLNGVVFTFVNGPVSGSQDVSIGTTTSATAKNLADSAETYTADKIATGPDPLTRSATFFAEDNVVRLYQREGKPLMTPGPYDPILSPFAFSLATSTGAITLSGANVDVLPDSGKYYDENTALVTPGYSAGSDSRGVFGSSDVTATACSFYGTDHHSLYRRDDTTSDYVTNTGGGTFSVSGMAGNASRKIQGLRFTSCRFASWEPFRIRLDRVNRAIFLGCHSEGRSSAAVKTTTGLPVEFTDADYYGPITLTTNAQNTVLVGFSSNLREAFIPSTVRLTNLAPAGSREVTRVSDILRTNGYLETSYGLRSINGELDIRSQTNLNLVRLRGGTSTYATFGPTGMNFGSGATTTIIAGFAGDMDIRSQAGGTVRLRSGSTSLAALDVNTVTFTTASAIRPSSDGTVKAGDATHRYSELYSANNTINTSDARSKLPRGRLTDAEIRAWEKVNPVIFQWLASVEKKGEAARLNAGYIAQDVKAAFESEGLDASRYALWCEDAITEVQTKTRVVTKPRVKSETRIEDKVVISNGRATITHVTVPDVTYVTAKAPLFDADGNPMIDSDGSQILYEYIVEDEIVEEYEEEVTTGETRLGLRYEQCLVFECAYLRSKLGV